MLDPSDGLIHCDYPECGAKHKNHAWGFIKAEGWFHSRDGEQAFCPEHLPDWVAAWRAKKKR